MMSKDKEKPDYRAMPKDGIERRAREFKKLGKKFLDAEEEQD
jgi:hypothetical protein